MGKKTSLTYVELPKKYLAACLKVLVDTSRVCYMEFMLTEGRKSTVIINEKYYSKVWLNIVGKNLRKKVQFLETISINPLISKNLSIFIPQLINKQGLRNTSTQGT